MDVVVTAALEEAGDVAVLDPAEGAAPVGRPEDVRMAASVEVLGAERREQGRGRPLVIGVALVGDVEAARSKLVEDRVLDAVGEPGRPRRGVAVEDEPVDVRSGGRWRDRFRRGGRRRRLARNDAAEVVRHDRDERHDHQGERGDVQDPRDGAEEPAAPPRHEGREQDDRQPARHVDGRPDPHRLQQPRGVTVGQERDDGGGQHQCSAPRIAHEQAAEDERDGRAATDQRQDRQHVTELHLVEVDRVQEQDEVGGEQDRMERPGPVAKDGPKAVGEPVHAAASLPRPLRSKVAIRRRSRRRPRNLTTPCVVRGR